MVFWVVTRNFEAIDQISPTTAGYFLKPVLDDKKQFYLSKSFVFVLRHKL